MTIASAIAIYAKIEPHRHACEVRFVANLPSREHRKNFLAGVRKHRGDEAAERIKNSLKRMAEKAA